MEGFDFSYAECPLSAEVKAMGYDLEKIKVAEIKNFTVISDCERAIKLMKGEARCPWYLKEQISDIKKMGEEMMIQGWIHKKREYNISAHERAKLGIKEKKE
ncbi:hypothetical protein Cni_G17075 [Canna indica]|uniref:RNase H type-1 domain-containing protein n=1 Tax=Canna indica TaxID=4628 RepID=A0AAQ3KGN3_9LILI|nr:hypothetical protein Cni_G17075 [Canna indica]